MRRPFFAACRRRGFCAPAGHIAASAACERFRLRRKPRQAGFACRAGEIFLGHRKSGSFCGESFAPVVARGFCCQTKAASSALRAGLRPVALCMPRCGSAKTGLRTHGSLGIALSPLIFGAFRSTERPPFWSAKKEGKSRLEPTVLRTPLSPLE